MNITCPHCGETSARHQLPRSEYPRIAPQLVGGLGSALVFELSRKRRFQCEHCGARFDAHTNASFFWFAFWVVVCVFLAFCILNLGWRLFA